MKNLIYVSVFYNKKYIELLKLLLQSLKQFGKIDENTDILILTNDSFEQEISLICQHLKINYIIESLNLHNVIESKYSRFKIFDLPKTNVQVYNKILYLDIDIIVQKDINNIFNLNISNKLYARDEGNISGEFFGSFLFQEWFQEGHGQNMDKKTRSFCSGVMLFKPCQEIKMLFQNTLNHIISYQNSGKKFGTCIDQPFINFNAIINNLHEIDLLSHIVTNSPDINTHKETICHFAGNTCNFDVKYNAMIKFYKHLEKK